MKKEVALKEQIGKTLEGFAFSPYYGHMVLSFSGGTFSALQAVGGDYPEIEEGELRYPLNFGDADLVVAGVATQEELDTLRAEQDAKYKTASAAAQETNDRCEYERLKRKYEG
jgi:hypothetical protein